MSANGVSGFLAFNMEFHVLYKIGVVSDPKEGSEAWDLRLKMAILEWISDW